MILELLDDKALEIPIEPGLCKFVRIDYMDDDDETVTVTYHLLKEGETVKISRKELQNLLTATIRSGVIWNQKDMTWYDFGEMPPEGE